MRKPVHLFLTLALAAGATAQTTSTTRSQQVDRVVVDTKLVTVNIIVTDGKGHYVKGLSEDQFTVYDNKIKQKIAHFSSEPAALSIGIVCEVHESRPEQTRTVLGAVKQFTSTLKSEDDFFFLAFSGSQIASELRQQYTLAFYSKATARVGWHNLRVRVRESQADSDLRLSYRKGYQLSRDQ
jgi:hypothetical protein